MLGELACAWGAQACARAERGERALAKNSGLRPTRLEKEENEGKRWSFFSQATAATRISSASQSLLLAKLREISAKLQSTHQGLSDDIRNPYAQTNGSQITRLRPVLGAPDLSWSLRTPAE